MSEWHSVGDAFYRRTVQYELAWSVGQLDEYLVATSADAAWIAMTRDPSQIVALSETVATEPRIQLYTGAGQLYESLAWDATARIAGMGFTSRDELVVVADDGHVRLYVWLVPTHEHVPCTEATPTSYYYTYSLGNDAADLGVAKVHVDGSHVWALLRNGALVVGAFVSRDMSVWSEAVPDFTTQTLPPLSAPRPQLCAWAPMPDKAQLLLCTPSTTWTANADGYTDLHSSETPMHAVQYSPDGHFIAWINARKQLVVDTADFSRLLRTYEIASSDAYKAAPLALRTAALLDEPDILAKPSDKGGLAGSGVYSMAWCGNHAVALAMANVVLIVGAYDAPLAFSVRGIPHLCGHANGVHIIHGDAHEYVSMVQPPTLASLRPGSTHAAAILLDAARHAHKHDPQAYEAVRAMGKDLVLAVETCIDAAALEWLTSTQSDLLRAALFGKTFLDAYDSAHFLDVSRILRVLNAVRAPTVGIPASHDDARHLSFLLYRLASRNQHKLAVDMCTFLGVRPDAVLKHWARAKVARARHTHRDDAAEAERLAHTIIDKFQAAGTLKYADIALCAWQTGHPRIATMLIDKEARACEQVPLLMHMHEHRHALKKAVESGDTDLVYAVMFALQRTLARGDFFRAVQSLEWPDDVRPGHGVGLRPSAASTYATLASNLLVAFALEQDRDMARDFFYQDDRHADMALMAIAEGAQMDLRERAGAWRRAQHHFDEDSRCALAATLAGQASSLLGMQAAVDTEGREPLLGHSLYDTIRACLAAGDERRADKLRHDYHVPDVRYYALRVRALIDAGDFDALSRLVSHRKPPSGYVMLVRTLIQAGHADEAAKYVAKGMQDKSSRSRLLTFIQQFPDPSVRARLERAVP